MQYVNLCELDLFDKVDDIKAAVTELKKKKIRILSEEPKIGAHGKPVIFLHPKDCHGVLVELEQAWAAIFINKTIEELWSCWTGAGNIDVVFSLHKFILVPMDEVQLLSTEILLQIQGLSLLSLLIWFSKLICWHFLNSLWF